MDQIILVSVCCPPQNEHIDIKKVANSHAGVTIKRRQKRSHAGVTIKRRQKRPKIHVLLLLPLLRHTFFVQAVSLELL